jgi:hypothetical protein
MAGPLGSVGSRHPGNDTPSNAAPETNRSKAQMFVLYRTYSHVRDLVSLSSLWLIVLWVRDRFLDMLMSKALGESNTESKNFTVIFEVRCFTVLVLNEIITYYVQRGIDPHVDEPDHCHVRIRRPQSST